jgi:hypothetical protein
MHLFLANNEAVVFTLKNRKKKLLFKTVEKKLRKEKKKIFLFSFLFLPGAT